MSSGMLATLMTAFVVAVGGAAPPPLGQCSGMVNSVLGVGDIKRVVSQWLRDSTCTKPSLTRLYARLERSIRICVLHRVLRSR